MNKTIRKIKDAFFNSFLNWIVKTTIGKFITLITGISSLGIVFSNNINYFKDEICIPRYSIVIIAIVCLFISYTVVYLFFGIVSRKFKKGDSVCRKGDSFYEANEMVVIRSRLLDFDKVICYDLKTKEVSEHYQYTLELYKPYHALSKSLVNLYCKDLISEAFESRGLDETDKAVEIKTKIMLLHLEFLKELKKEPAFRHIMKQEKLKHIETNLDLIQKNQ